MTDMQDFQTYLTETANGCIKDLQRITEKL